ncbi:MAG: tetratricopeptide repeat protein [Elusimicrobia bacterium]|nr:tetratricopeptide repeat protein [Elusimicrobiota bacterium]
MKRLTALVALLAAFAAKSAQGAFEDLGAGARGPGMGDAFVAVADDVHALYYNPAGLAQLERPQFAASYSRLHLGLTDKSDLNTSYLGYAQPILGGRHGTIGTSWNSFALGSLYREQAFGLSYGRRVGRSEGLHAGGTVKYLHSGLGDLPEATNAYTGIALSGQADPALSKRGQGAFDADLGLLWRFARHYSVGLQAMHVPQPNVAFESGVADRLPMVLKSGFAYRSLVSNLVAQVDTQRSPTGTRDTRFTVGAERWFARLFIGEFGLRGALALGTREHRQVTVGLSYRTRRLGVDYAFGLPVGGFDSPTGAHRVGLSFRFGPASEEDESLEFVLEAMRQLKKREAAPSIRVLGRGLSLDQKATVEELVAQGRALEQQARYRDALEKLSAAMTLAPAEAEMLAKYGRLHYIAQQIPSLPDYKSDPLQASMHQGLLAYLAGKDRLAVSRLGEALRLKPEYRELDVFLSGLERITGHRRTAAPAASPPKNYRLAAGLTRADTAIQEGRYRDAIDLSLAVLKEDERHSAAWQNLGTAYFALKDYERSLGAWRRALQLEREPALKAEIRGYVKSVEKAIKRGATSRTDAPPPPERPRLSPSEVQSMFERAVDHYTRRRLPEARDLLRRILEADPENAEAKKALRRVEEELR